MTDSDWNVVIGQVTTTFGNKGELKVRPETDHPERFTKLKEVCIARGKDDRRILEISGVRFHKGAVLLKLVGVDDMNAAEELRGAEVRVCESDRRPLAEHEYYVHDIIGLEVFTTEGENLGRVKEILRSPAHDVYVTERAMIPAVKEYVISVDLDSKKMVVRAVEGLVQE